jgi:hypothetical protein
MNQLKTYHVRLLVVALLTQLPLGKVNATSCTASSSSPTNTTCSSAYQIPTGCNQLTYTYSGVAETCLWFSFRACEAVEHANIEVDGGRVRLVQPLDQMNPCASSGACFDPAPLPPFSYSGSLAPGLYLIVVRPPSNSGTITIDLGAVTTICPLPCEDCIPVFGPSTGSNYIINAWAHELNAGQTATNFSAPRISVSFWSSTNTSTGTAVPVETSGVIIDDWQRMEAVFTVPPSTAYIKVELTTTNTHDVFYDDIRVFPEDASMKCYVYDPVNLRFMAELDERHYATFYEYDGEGKLTRVKKETERGTMTIQETRSNSSKLSGPTP